MLGSFPIGGIRDIDGLLNALSKRTSCPTPISLAVVSLEVLPVWHSGLAFRSLATSFPSM